MLIKLIENTDYKYDALYRFYGWQYADTIYAKDEYGQLSIGEFYLACLDCWSFESCSARFRPSWTPDNPSVGQCSITARIAYELFGGELLSLPLNGGGMHSFNKINGVIIDLACEQFGKNALLDFENAVPASADELLVGGDKAERCALLRKALHARLGI